MNWEKVKAYANGCLETFFYLNNFKNFNYTKIYQSTVLRLGPNFIILYIILPILAKKSFQIYVVMFSTQPYIFKAKSSVFWK